MSQPFVGAEALRSGTLSRGTLRWNLVAIHPGVYVERHADRTIFTNAVAAWLWTSRSVVIARSCSTVL